MYKNGMITSSKNVCCVIKVTSQFLLLTCIGTLQRANFVPVKQFGAGRKGERGQNPFGGNRAGAKKSMLLTPSGQ